VGHIEAEWAAAAEAGHIASGGAIRIPCEDRI